MDINRNNYETFFLLYLDRELDPAAVQEVDRFLGENEDLQREFALLQKTLFVPSEMLFSQKESLYRHEEKRGIVPFYWMRIAAAAAVLIISSWLIIAKSLKSNGIRTEQAQNILPDHARPSSEVKKKDNRQSQSVPDVNRNQLIANENPEQPQKMLNKNFGVVDLNLKSKRYLYETNNPQTSSRKDEQNSSSNDISDEPVMAVKKSGTPELQTPENVGYVKQMIAITRTQSPVLLLASANTGEPVKYEDAVIKENEYPSDNAISVVSLNNNKGILRFLKKITKREEANDNTRKLRVSVFQFSY